MKIFRLRKERVEYFLGLNAVETGYLVKLLPENCELRRELMKVLLFLVFLERFARKEPT